MKPLAFAIILGLTSSTAAAAPISPYANETRRPIKALTAQQVDDYLNGRGMGYAMAAELNHYPGPRHVLDLADALGLDSGQASRTRTIFETMRSEAIALGRELVAAEQELDRRFAEGSIDAPSLDALLTAIGALQARIRHVHLAAHLEQRALLSPHQVRIYDRLRGYPEGAGHDHGH